MNITFQNYDSTWVRNLRAGGVDDNGQPAERAISDGGGNPCRHCLQYIPEGDQMLIAAARPFTQLHPYAECGPVFFCAQSCAPWKASDTPPVLQSSPDYLLKAYDRRERIIYSTGNITAAADLRQYAETLLKRDDVAFVDIRSSRNNCFLTRVVTCDQ
ncbi:DUF1203 domain-containing protein [Halocynthiibacter sp.]|uniref:DUF1203 domain-containing protein n=1 Tax=Halocynthiibacter sp. TaxID=1979210 RepID=UPI003C493C51